MAPMQLLLKMPDLGATGSEIRITRWLITPGQRVQRGQPLLEVETDKAVSEVESAFSGLLKEIRAGQGQAVAVGEVIAVLEMEAAAEPLPPAVPAKPWEATALSGSAHEHDRRFLLALYRRMLLIREFEERVKSLFLEGSMPGTVHQCQGQEATAVGVCSALQKGDWITSTFRGHGHALAKGLSVQELMDELFGAQTGCCKGRGGSMHVGNMAKGMVPGIAIVGGGIPVAAGMALAFKKQKTSQVVACFFGDGAVAEGAFHEGVNMAAIWALPVIYVCENNLYGASTHISKAMKNTRISDRAAAYGFRGETVDGNDVLAVRAAALRAARECREGRGPVLLELLTYRRTGHSRRDACHYQPEEERETWFGRDPLERFAATLLQRGDISAEDLGSFKKEVESEINQAVERARVAPLPSPHEVAADVFI